MNSACQIPNFVSLQADNPAPSSRQGCRHWLAGLGIAGSLHAIALSALLLHEPAANARQAGPEAIHIDLGTLGALGSEVQDQRAAASSNPQPPSEPEQTAEAPPPPENPAPSAIAAPKPEQPRRKPEKPREKPPVQKPQAQPVARAETPTEQQSSQNNSGEAQKNSYQSSNGSQNSASGGGNPQLKPSYFSQVAAQLARHKRYPLGARRNGEEGTATLLFSVERSGRVTSYQIVVSSGSERLDEAVLRMLRDAAPLPPFPPEMSENQLNIRLPIAFSLKD